MLLRISHRGAAAETDNVDEFCDTEFQRDDGAGLDLRLSVYAVEAPEVLRAHAEHSARARCGPQAQKNFDMAGLGIEPTPDPLESGFAFTAAAHRELVAPDAAAVKTLAGALLATLAARRHPTTKAQLKAYARGQRDAADPEWIAFFECGDKCVTQW